MILKFLCKKSVRIILLFIIIFLLYFGVKTIVQYYSVKPLSTNDYLTKLSSVNTTVSTEMLSEDIDIILNAYNLKKDASKLLQGEGNSIYDIYYKKYGSDGKSIFMSVCPIGFENSNRYVEIETLMEIWLYVIQREFNYDINGITYYFSAPEPFIGGRARANEIYMSKEEFYSLYNQVNIDGLSHQEKVKMLTDAYLEQSNYQRRQGHIQVTTG